MMRWNRIILLYCIFHGAAARAHAVTQSVVVALCLKQSAMERCESSLGSLYKHKQSAQKRKNGVSVAVARAVMVSISRLGSVQTWGIPRIIHQTCAGSGHPQV